LRGAGGDRKQALALLGYWRQSGALKYASNGSPILQDGQALPWVDTSALGGQDLAAYARGGEDLLSANNAGLAASRAAEQQARWDGLQANAWSERTGSSGPQWHDAGTEAIANFGLSTQTHASPGAELLGAPIGSSEWLRTASVTELHAHGYQTLGTYDPVQQAAYEAARQRIGQEIAVQGAGPVLGIMPALAMDLHAPAQVVDALGVANFQLGMSAVGLESRGVEPADFFPRNGYSGSLSEFETASPDSFGNTESRIARTWHRAAGQTLECPSGQEEER
jgi:hypothetical protein